MSSGDLYNSGYGFARQNQRRKKKQLLVAGIGFLSLIIAVLIYSVASTFLKSGKSSESVDKIFTQEDQQEEEGQRYLRLAETYKSANLPYDDPQGRFSIVFMTPFVSEEVGVVIRSEKDYDKAKSDAEEIIAKAKKTVSITSVSYINDF